MENLTTKCIACDKELELECHEGEYPTVYGAGQIVISFGYGSKFDFLSNSVLGFNHEDKRHLKLIYKSEFLQSNIISYICDECFEKKAEYFSLYREKPRVFVKEI